MFNQLRRLFIVFVFIILCGCLNGGNSPRNNKDNDWTFFPGYNGPEYELISFQETQEAFPNPMKGFRPGIGPGLGSFGYHEYGRVYKQYVMYSDLESSSEDTVQKILDWCNIAWTGIELRNIKVIPRVVLTFPTNNQPGH
jgi:hypothetical protein